MPASLMALTIRFLISFLLAEAEIGRTHPFVILSMSGTGRPLLMAFNVTIASSNRRCTPLAILVELSSGITKPSNGFPVEG